MVYVCRQWTRACGHWWCLWNTGQSSRTSMTPVKERFPATLWLLWSSTTFNVSLSDGRIVQYRSFINFLFILLLQCFLLSEWWGAGTVICLEQGAGLHKAQLMPLPLTVSCFSKIQIGFTFLVRARPGRPGKRVVKWVCVCMCVCAFC